MANPLITKTTYKIYAQVKETDKNVNDKLITSLINSTSDYIVQYTGREFIAPASDVEEIFDGNGTERYYIKNRKFNDTTTNVPTLYWWDGDSWTELTTSTYPRAYDDNSGLVWFNNGHKFLKGYRNYKIAHQYGWSQATIPADIQEAVAEIVKKSIMRLSKAGIITTKVGTSEATIDQSIIRSATGGAATNAIKQILDNYKVVCI